jgi:hypothetical protein
MHVPNFFKSSNKYDRAMGEILILLPEKSKRVDNLEFFQPLENKKTLNLACPYYATVFELRLRICGLTHIPIEKIRLLYGGEILKDSDFLEKEVFNTEVSTADPVDDVFRCRSM